LKISSKRSYFFILNRTTPVAKIIHNFGRTDQLDRKELVRLLYLIARVCGLTVVDPFSVDNEKSSLAGTGLPEALSIKMTVTQDPSWPLKHYGRR